MTASPSARALCARLVQALLLVLCIPATAQAQYYGRTSPIVTSDDTEPADENSEPSPLTKPRRLQLLGHVGYAFGGSVSEEDVGSATLTGGPSVGGTASYLVWSGGRVHMSFTQQMNGVEIEDELSESIEKYDLTVRMLQFGGTIDTYLRPSGGRIWPHFGFTLGATQFDPDSPDYTVDWTFSWMIEGGVTYWLIKHIGITALMRLNGHVIQADGGAFCVQGESCVYLRSTQLLFQGEIGGGITLAL